MKRYGEMDIARGIGIILVILGHALALEKDISKMPVASYTFEIIYSFHMALLVLVAGFVMGISLYKKDRYTLIAKKAQRLLIPYFIAGILYFLMKTVIARVKHFEYNEAKNLWKMLIGVNPNFSMWFLYILFAFSVIAIILVRKKNIIYLSIIAVIVSCLFGSMQICELLCYFFIGILLYSFYEKISKYLYKWYLQIIALVIFICGFIARGRIKNNICLNGINIVIALSACVIVLYISQLLSKVNNPISKTLVTTGKYSMDIYIIGSLIQPMMKLVFAGSTGVKYWIYVIGSTVAIIVISIVVSKFIIRKVKVFRRLLLGLD